LFLCQQTPSVGVPAAMRPDAVISVAACRRLASAYRWRRRSLRMVDHARPGTRTVSTESPADLHVRRPQPRTHRPQTPPPGAATWLVTLSARKSSPVRALACSWYHCAPVQSRNKYQLSPTDPRDGIDPSYSPAGPNIHSPVTSNTQFLMPTKISPGIFAGGDFT